MFSPEYFNQTCILTHIHVAQKSYSVFTLRCFLDRCSLLLLTARILFTGTLHVLFCFFSTWSINLRTLGDRFPFRSLPRSNTSKDTLIRNWLNPSRVIQLFIHNIYLLNPKTEDVEKSFFILVLRFLNNKGSQTLYKTRV